ncbi:LuxR C-terminal-related transcriptional regulator [Microbacterium awajiense]|uniref:LuxR C-terminal-related transcriptional regulator n=1 Tax=Microbacterium awajiense TaxID=415214 RepID=A0ABP7AD77_9MICO
MSAALRDLAERTRFPLVFGGFVDDGAVRVSVIHGSRTRSLQGLVVQSGRGLGGQAMTQLGPRMTPDYGSSRAITHDYDSHVLGEGIGALLAVPVVVAGRSRGMLYAGTWARSGIGDVSAAPAMRVARDFASELRIRDEVERRVAALAPPTPPAEHAAQRERLRESVAELRSIAAQIEDPVLRERLAALGRRLAGPAPAASGHGARLAPRELDVLAWAALGSTNAEIAQALALKEGTVKSYLQSAMSKLDASTRHAAVAKARSLGILP